MTVSDGRRAVIGEAFRRERVRQVDCEWRHMAGDDATGWLPLLLAARAYAEERPDLWPFGPEGFKAKDRFADLVRAGALAMAAGEVAVRMLAFPALVHVETVARDIVVMLDDLSRTKPRLLPAWMREKLAAL